MTKGYWIATGKINSPEIKTYAETIGKLLPKVGGKFLIKDFDSIEKGARTGHFTIVIEFSSKLAAISAYESHEYQEMIAIRTNFSTIQLSIVEGF
tara:strand:- start:216 stop:500 length:285 start_codon:yes stop_codon:yes gene_type:complete